MTPKIYFIIFSYVLFLLQTADYGQVITVIDILSPNISYAIQNKLLEVRCIANATPPPTLYSWKINKKLYSSINNTFTFNVGYAIKYLAISCTPRSNYGAVGPTEEKFLPVYDLPRLSSGLSTRYNMTTQNITLRVSVTGYPSPTLSLINADTGEVVSNKEYFVVPYMKCADKILTYYWHATNIIGNVNSTKIEVQVITGSDECKKDRQKDRQTPDDQTLLGLFIGLPVGGLSVGGLIAIICYRRRQQRLKTDACIPVTGTSDECAEPLARQRSIHQSNENAEHPDSQQATLQQNGSIEEPLQMIPTHKFTQADDKEESEDFYTYVPPSLDKTENQNGLNTYDLNSGRGVSPIV